MAKIVDSLPRRNKGRGPIYPWDKWLDGRVWQLKLGEDFLVKPVSFRQMAYLAAAKAGTTVSVRIVDEYVYVQARRG